MRQVKLLTRSPEPDRSRHGPAAALVPRRRAACPACPDLVGMANGLGGTVLIGVSPRSGQVHGVTDPDEAVDRVFQACLLVTRLWCSPCRRCTPCPVLEPPRHLLSVTVPAGLPNVYRLDGRYLGREGHQTNPLPARRLRELLIERGAIQFEARVSPRRHLGRPGHRPGRGLPGQAGPARRREARRRPAHAQLRAAYRWRVFPHLRRAAAVRQAAAALGAQRQPAGSPLFGHHLLQSFIKQRPPRHPAPTDPGG